PARAPLLRAGGLAAGRSAQGGVAPRRARCRGALSKDAAHELPFVVVREERERLADRHPTHLVDLVLRAGIAGRRHAEVPNLLRALRHLVVRAARLRAERAAKPRLLLDLAQRALLPRLAGFELPLRKRPVVVARAVHEQDAPVTLDEPACGPSHGQTSSRSASPWPPPLQIAARPSPPPDRRSSCTIVATIRPPEAPIGCPSATAPPFTLTSASSAPSRRVEFSATDAKASLISTRFTSPIDFPARSSAIAPALAGVRAR